MSSYRCDDCAVPLSVQELYYYERRCERCEGAWDDRMGAWMRGETIEPELDAMFSVRSQKSQS